MVARDHRSSAHEDCPRFHALQAGYAAAPDRAAHGDGRDRDRRHGSVSRDAAQRQSTSSTFSPRTCSSMSPASSAIQRCSISWRRRSFPSLVRNQAPDQPSAHLDCRLQHGRGDLFPCHAVPRADHGGEAQRQASGLRLRCRPGCRRQSPARASIRKRSRRMLSPARLARFFSKEERGYRVSPELRAAVVFTVQDVLADPPFSRLDLVSCRNLLIYLRA